MGNRKTFQRLVGFGVVFAMSLGLFSVNVGHFNRYTTEAAVKKSEVKLSKEADKAYKEVESLILRHRELGEPKKTRRRESIYLILLRAMAMM